MPNMKNVVEKITKEVVMTVLYLFSLSPATMQLQPIVETGEKRGNKLLDSHRRG
jgi:hypothetical protein